MGYVATDKNKADSSTHTFIFNLKFFQDSYKKINVILTKSENMLK